jgi:hypothetical protein
VLNPSQMSTEDHFVAALRSLCETQEGGYRAVAEKAHISPDNLWQIINGVKLPSGNPRGVGPKLRTKLTAAFPDWLRGATLRSIPAVSDTLNGGEIVIHQLETGGRMGGSGLILRDQPGVIQAWHVSGEWIRKNVHNVSSPNNLAIVTGFGDSMKPMFNPGDPLLVDTGVKSVEFDAVYFFRIGEEGFIKRLQRVPGEGLVAISENKAYRDWVIRDGMDFQVFARVVKVWRGEDI